MSEPGHPGPGRTDAGRTNQGGTQPGGIDAGGIDAGNTKLNRHALANTMRFASYNIAGSTVLRNRLGITDAEELRQAEYQFTAIRNETLPPVRPTVAGLKAVHHHLFQDVYDWAGEFRTANMALGGVVNFADWQTLQASAERLFAAVAQEAREAPAHHIEQFAERAARLTGALNRMHPFREGNGRTMRAFLTGWGREQGFRVDFEYVAGADWVDASAGAYHNEYRPMTELVVREHAVSLERTAAASGNSHGRFARARTVHEPGAALGL